MTRQIEADDLTRLEIAALKTLFRSYGDAAEFREGASEQKKLSVEEIIERERNETPEQRDARAKKWIATIDAGRRAGMLHDPELFLWRVFTVEQIHTRRMMDGTYDSELADVQDQIRQVEKRHGLEEDEYFPVGEGPPEWEALQNEFDATLERLFVATLREFELLEEAQLREKEPQEFDRRRELGRRAVFDGLSDLERLEMCQVEFEQEALASAEAGAFHAAATMIGAAIEAALLARCLRRPEEAEQARVRLQRPERPEKADPRKWGLHSLTRVAAEASWLPEFHVGNGVLPSDALIDMVRELRNMVHPATHLQSVVTNRIARAKYEAARATYDLLRRHLAG